MFNKDHLGSGALLTALALSVSSAYAQETKDEQSSAEKEKQALSCRQMEKIQESSRQTPRTSTIPILRDLNKKNKLALHTNDNE